MALARRRDAGAPPTTGMTDPSPRGTDLVPIPTSLDRLGARRRHSAAVTQLDTGATAARSSICCIASAFWIRRRGESLVEGAKSHPLRCFNSVQRIRQMMTLENLTWKNLGDKETPLVRPSINVKSYRTDGSKRASSTSFRDPQRLLGSIA